MVFDSGPAVEWYDALIAHFRHSGSVRLWFVQNILFAQPSHLSEYLLESPSSEVSNVSFSHPASLRIFVEQL